MADNVKVGASAGNTSDTADLQPFISKFILVWRKSALLMDFPGQVSKAYLSITVESVFILCFRIIFTSESYIAYKAKTDHMKKKSIKLLQLLLCISCCTNSYAQSHDHKNNEHWLRDFQAAASSIVLLNNEPAIIPLKDLQQKIASVNINAIDAAAFDSLLNKYTNVTSFAASKYDSDSSLYGLSDDLKFYKTIIVQVTAQGLNDKRTINFILDIKRSKQLVLVVTGKFKFLKYADDIDQPIIWTEKKTNVTDGFCAQLIFGGVGAKAKIKRSYTSKYIKGTGNATSSIRMAYTVPEETGINIEDIARPIDSLVANAIDEKAIPGAVVLILKDGKVIFNKAFGYHTYDRVEPMLITDIFDLASVTKVSATTMAIMHLYEQKKIALDSTFGYYIPSARNTDKSNIKIRELLLHQSGLQPDVDLPLLPIDVNTDSSAAYPLKAGEKVFIRKEYFTASMWPHMLNSKMDTRGQYVYSDLSMTYMKEVVERQSLEKLDQYVQEHFYGPLGMQTAGFNPLNRFDIKQIVPTENEEIFRKQWLRGYVHDPTAARYGGVSGNAGLFASANDLAMLYQMILNGGTYGDVQYFQPETIHLFTSGQSAVSRRGLGFDRKDTASENAYPSKLASMETYGHTGFTGTSFWVDPDKNVVFIFLSNRVYPKVNDAIYKLHTQGNIMDAVYKAIKKGAGTGR